MLQIMLFKCWLNLKYPEVKKHFPVVVPKKAGEAGLAPAPSRLTAECNTDFATPQ